MSDDPEGTATLDAGPAQPPARVKRDFWILVGVANAALLALALGALLLAFTGRRTVATVLLGLGVGLTGYGVRRYRRRKA